MTTGRVFEEGRFWQNGRAVERVFVWTGEPSWPALIPASRLQGHVGEALISLRRGENLEQVELDHEVLPRLVAACRHWLAERDEWGAFVYTRAAWPGKAGRSSYQRPGRGSKFVDVVDEPSRPRRRLFKRAPKRTAVESGPRENEVRRPLEPRVAIAPGVILAGSLWNAGVGRPECLLGSVYDIRPDIRLTARRYVAEIRVGRSKLQIAAGEVPFIEQLALIRP